MHVFDVLGALLRAVVAPALDVERLRAAPRYVYRVVVLRADHRTRYHGPCEARCRGYFRRCWRC